MANQPPTKHSGAAVYRGPMADDNFVQIHNLVVRGKTAIHTRYVGVWGFVTSHVEGWKMTETSIARELHVGVDFVRSALKSIESAGCLVRTRLRNGDGTLGDSAWFVTDLPIQLQQLGITDPEIINTRVSEEYEAWLNRLYEDHFPSATPNSEKPTLGAASDDDPQPAGHKAAESRFPSAAPKSDKPSLGEPSQADPGTKKTRGKKTSSKKTNQTNASTEGDESKASDPPRDGWSVGEAAEGTKEPRDAGTSETGSDGAELLRSLGITGRAVETWAATVDAALGQLGHKQTRHTLANGLDNAERPTGAIITTRLPQLHARLNSARSSAASQARTEVPEWCGTCTDRWVMQEDERLAPCPKCHPGRRSAASAA